MQVLILLFKLNYFNCAVGKIIIKNFIAHNDFVLPMVALLKTKFKMTNKMKTKNETPKNDLNATIGNTVLSAVLIQKVKQ